MTQRSIVHATFSLERTYAASPERVFRAFADPDVKAKWFVGPEDWDQTEVVIDFRIGGREVNNGGPKSGPISRFYAQYYDIVPDNRIVYAYEMYLDDTRISVSLATIELAPLDAGRSTRLTITENGAFFDGHEDPALREHGTRELLEALAGAVEAAPVHA
jgi:uncharacterized protein YndB with AHSA1/START domain